MSTYTWRSAQCVASSSDSATYTSMPQDDDYPYQGSSFEEQYISYSQPEESQPAQRLIKSELTQSPDFRLLRPSTVLPRRPTHSSTSPEVAIQTQDYNRNNYSRQDVPPFVNTSASYLSSPATRTDAFSHYLGPSVSSSSPSNVLIHRRQRPRTSNQVFTSSHGSITAHDLPKSLPPAPSTAPRRTHSEPEHLHLALPDFASMSSNYLNMLSQKPDNTMPTDSTTEYPVSPSDLEPVVPEHDYQEIVDVLKQAMQPPPTPETPELWTSPAFTDFGDDFLSSFSPDNDPLNTPVVNDGDDMLTGLFDDDGSGGMNLFPSIDYSSYIYDKPAEQSALSSLPIDKLYTFTPESPALHDFSPAVNPSSIYPSPRLPSDRSSFPSPALSTATGSRRKSSATGTRKGVTPEALVPVDAPTQPRKYVIPSATSRKEVPLIFAKKRSRSTAFGEEDDELNEPPLAPDATEKEQIEYKRRQNTVAARRSRKRKLQHQQELEEKCERLQREKDMWNTRAVMCQEMLHAHGIPFPAFQDTLEED